MRIVIEVEDEDVDLFLTAHYPEELLATTSPGKVKELFESKIEGYIVSNLVQAEERKASRVAADVAKERFKNKSLIKRGE